MEYLWLSEYIKLDYTTYKLLINIFKDIRSLYIASKEKEYFIKLLRKNNINLSYIIFSNLINQDYKDKANEDFIKLNNKNINIIDIDSKYYPENLKRVYNPPLVLFTYGDLSLLLNRKIYVYNSSSFSAAGIKIHNEFSKIINKNNISIVQDKLTYYTNILYIPYIKIIKRNNLLIISDKINRNLFLNYEITTGISDMLFISESNYNNKIAMIVDLILEQGKDILVVPGSIYNKEAYFSNYLIKEGAVCIVSESDLSSFISLTRSILTNLK